MRLELRRRTTVAHVSRDSVTRFTVPQLQNIGRQLLDSVPAPRGGEATDNRCTLYFRSLATVLPTEAVRILSTPDANLPSQDSLLGLCVSRIADIDRRYAAQLIQATPDQVSRCYLWIGLAQHESDPDVRTDQISEALIAARQLAGSDYMTAMASVATVLWELGCFDDAQDVLREAWDKSPQLQAILTNGDRKEQVAESRYFARTMALIDPAAAMKLLELTASPNELKGLQTEALLLVADSNREAFDKMIAQFGYANLEPSSVTWFLDSCGIRDIATIAAIVNQLPDSMHKAESFVKLARRAHALGNDAAEGLCGEALPVLYRLDLSHAEENAYFHYSTRAAALVRDVALRAP